MIQYEEDAINIIKGVADKHANVNVFDAYSGLCSNGFCPAIKDKSVLPG